MDEQLVLIDGEEPRRRTPDTRREVSRRGVEAAREALRTAAARAAAREAARRRARVEVLVEMASRPTLPGMGQPARRRPAA
jgi:hypothetical protein